MKFRYRAAIFDMDGTILDSMTAWRSLGREYLLEKGLEAPEEMNDLCRITCHRCAELITARYEPERSPMDIYQELEYRMVPHYTQDVMPKPYAPHFLKLLNRQGVICCVATATQPDMARAALARHDLLRHLRFLSGGNDMGVEKGDPEYFVRIARRLGVKTEECAVFEDAAYAIRSAKRAGCAVYAIQEQTACRQRREIMETADFYIGSFADLVQGGEDRVYCDQRKPGVHTDGGKSAGAGEVRRE